MNNILHGHKKFASWSVFLLVPTVAAAYFLTIGFGTGTTHATTGTAPTALFTVAMSAENGSATISPGVGTSTHAITVTNGSAGSLVLTTVTAAMAHDVSGNILDTANGNAPKIGCLASYYTPTVTGGPSLPLTITATNSSPAGNVNVTMPTNAGVDQSVCEGTAPQVIVTASS
jgi:hypothetical protein